VLLLKGLNLLAEAEKSYIKRRRPEESCRREGGRGEKVPAGHSDHCCKRWGGCSSAREMTTRDQGRKGGNNCGTVQIVSDGVRRCFRVEWARI
jgi:hypothetical protein